MDLKLYPGKLSGSVSVIPSKSLAHRYLICAAFSDGPTQILCSQTSRDMDATADCLRALGAEIHRTSLGYSVTPGKTVPNKATLPCRDSGSTLRFLLPVVGALGVEADFLLEGRLASRPLSPLWEEMERMGCRLYFPESNILRCSGQLQPGEYRIDGGVTSQFLTGLLLAGALMNGTTAINVTGQLQSKPYLAMTQYAMAIFGRITGDLTVIGGFPFRSPGKLSVEGDWSNGAFFLAANALGSSILTDNLSPDSPQGDRACAELLPALDRQQTISAADIPDLIPVLAVVAACKKGAEFTQIQRLRLKESDRVASVVNLIRSLGGEAFATSDTLTVQGTGLMGGTVDCCNDHRIAMATAIAVTVCREPVVLLGAECVEKSYPQFFQEYRRLGGKYEQYLR